jgi:alkanesulfonate monooxygenase SsuD/methylene tetrahydromethanopterin reductase-like flavin-dependent oxidoreductase (luciferase family)
VKIATTPWDWTGLHDVQALCAQAELAESLGLHSFWLPESHFAGQRSIPAPLTLLAAVAARTRRIGLGCTSYLLPIRHPLQAAEEVAVLDQLSGGRLILGLGRGLQKEMFSAFDVASKDKRSLFAANLAQMRRAWRGESVLHGASDATDAGHPERVAMLSPLPVQRPEPELWVAAFGPLALQQVAQLGLPYLASPMETITALERNYAHHREQAAQAGQTLPQVVPIMRTVYVADSAAQVAAARQSVQAELRGRGLDADAVDDSAIIGEPDAVRERLQEYVARLGMTHLIVRAGIAGIDAQQQVSSLRAVARMHCTV